MNLSKYEIYRELKLSWQLRYGVLSLGSDCGVRLRKQPYILPAEVGGIGDEPHAHRSKATFMLCAVQTGRGPPRGLTTAICGFS